MKILKTLFVCVALLFTATFVSGREKEDFEKVMKQTATASKDLSSAKYYENLEFSNKKTGEKKKFSDFSELDRQVFTVMLVENFGHDMEELYNKWKEELAKAEDKPDDENEASKKDIAEYMANLTLLRKKNAERLESLLDKMFKKWPDKFTEEEKSLTLKKVRDYHDKHKLIKRE
jgi:hypothetical protein